MTVFRVDPAVELVLEGGAVAGLAESVAGAGVVAPDSVLVVVDPAEGDEGAGLFVNALPAGVFLDRGVGEFVGVEAGRGGKVFDGEKEQFSDGVVLEPGRTEAG